MRYISSVIMCLFLLHCSNSTNDNITISYQDTHTSTKHYIVTYNANGTSGSTPIDTNVYNPNDIVTVLPNVSLQKEGYAFTGWSFCPDCTQPIYKPGYTFTINASVMFYACFSDTVYSVIYNSGDADSGTPPIDTNYYVTGDIAYIKANTNLYKSGHTFSGWEDTGNNILYPGDTVIIGNLDVALTAHFTAKPYSVTYHANGATTGTVPVDSNYYDKGELATIAPNTGNLAIINRDGVSYCFDYWGDSSGNMYLPNNTYPIQESLILYAHYRPFAVGDSGPCGGCVFYDKGYYSDGWRYLEAMRYDLRPSGIVWEQQLEAGQYHQTGATASEAGTGFTNTSTIIQVLRDGDYAANACALCSDGWYLPSKDELDLLYQNKSNIGNFTGYNYWSSTESTTSKAWCQNFNSGTQSTQYKNSVYRVRPIRQF